MHPRLIIVLLVALIANQARATPAFFETLKKTYNIAADSEAGKRGCLNCHTAVPKRNEFGKQVEDALDSQNAMKVTSELLHSLDAKDADGDGFTNGDELSQGFVPSDPESHPVLKSTSQSAGAAVPKAGQPKESAAPLIPTHSFHPVLIHFPIALLLVGFLFDFFGHKRKEQWLKRAGWLNVTLGLATYLIVVPTGIAAWLRMGWKLEGVTLVHFVTAISSLIFGVIAWALMNRATRSPIFWLFAGLTIISVAIAGHFGGAMVYP